MNKFLFKSTPADLSKNITLSKLDILMKNVLYITHELDQVKKIVKNLENASGLQKQVDEYFERDDETSPQTESDEQ